MKDATPGPGRCCSAGFNTFCRQYLNAFLNFHRPCLFATDKPDPNKPGRIKRVYRAKDAMTPLDKLSSLPHAATFPCATASPSNNSTNWPPP